MRPSEEKLPVADRRSILISSLLAGGVAGTAVDVTLFPLDTLKTRLQSSHGFAGSGGFSDLYKGISTVILGSAPTAALFFVTYESVKATMRDKVSDEYHRTLLHMGAASLAEMVACLIRVPVEVVKQRRQALSTTDSRIGADPRLLYRGYWSTVSRDMPFSLLQFPLWEYLKVISTSRLGRDISPAESAACGALAGGISAAATTPLDVVKTRIMLASKTTRPSELRILNVLGDVYGRKGVSGLFAGIGPRIAWITVGGFVFFGAYEHAKLATIEYILEPFRLSRTDASKC